MATAAGTGRAEVNSLRVLAAACLGSAFVLFSAGLPAAGQPEPPGEPVSVDALRERAREILAGVQEREVPLSVARRQIEQLLRELKAVGEAEGWTPVNRRLEMTIARPEDLRPTLTEECPLFFEEELIQLCPLDQSRSEIWGNQVLVCEFACAPEADSSR